MGANEEGICCVARTATDMSVPNGGARAASGAERRAMVRSLVCDRWCERRVVRSGERSCDRWCVIVGASGEC